MLKVTPPTPFTFLDHFPIVFEFNNHYELFKCYNLKILNNKNISQKIVWLEGTYIKMNLPICFMLLGPFKLKLLKNSISRKNKNEMQNKKKRKGFGPSPLVAGPADQPAPFLLPLTLTVRVHPDVTVTRARPRRPCPAANHAAPAPFASACVHKSTPHDPVLAAAPPLALNHRVAAARTSSTAVLSSSDPRTPPATEEGRQAPVTTRRLPATRRYRWYSLRFQGITGSSTPGVAAPSSSFSGEPR